MLSAADRAAESAERMTIAEELGDLDYIESRLEAMVSKIEEENRHGMSDTIAAWVDRFRDMIGECQSRADTLMRM